MRIKDNQNTVTINGSTRPLTEFEAELIDMCSRLSEFEKQKVIEFVFDIAAHGKSLPKPTNKK